MRLLVKVIYVEGEHGDRRGSRLASNRPPTYSQSASVDRSPSIAIAEWLLQRQQHLVRYLAE